MVKRTVGFGKILWGLLLIPVVSAYAQINISNSPSLPSVSPRMATDGLGNVHSVWIERDNYPYGDVYYAKGDFSTRQISTPINISNSAVVYSDTMEMCSIAVDGSNRIYVLWTEGWEPTCSLKLRICTNGTWAAPYTVTTGLHFRTPRIAVTSGGDIYLVFWDFEWKVRSTARINGQWEAIQLIGSESELAKMADIDVGNNIVAATMAKKAASNGIYQTAYFSRGKGFNAGWSAASMVAPSGVDEVFSCVRLDSNDTAHILWMNDTGNRIVQYAQKNSSGFTAPLSLSGWGLLHNPFMAKKGDDMFFVWQVGAYGNGTSVVYDVRRADGSWLGGTSVPNSGGVTYCDIAASPDRSVVYFVWDTLLDIGNGDIYGWALANSNPLEISALTPSPSLPQNTGTPITWTATVSGGTAPYQYRFYLYSASTNSWSLAQDYGPANNWTWTPTQAGQYAVQTWVRNAGSTTNYDAWKGSGYFNITGSSILNVTALNPSPAPPQGTGTTITWTALTAGGTSPLQFRFYLYSAATNAWTMIRDYAASNTWSWTPTQAGQYAVQVWVRNAGSTTNYDAWKGSGYFNITAASTPLTVTSLKASPAPPQSAGTTITWTAAATGGTAPLQYQYWLYSGVTGTWTMARDYSTSASWSWTPTQAAQYAIQVWVRNAGSKTNYDASKGSGYFNITAAPTPLTVTSLKASPAPPQSAGTTITWTTTATGGTAPLQYQYLLYSGVTGTWTIARDYNTSASWSWTPTQAAQYAIQVWVRNAGSTANYDAWLGSGYFTIR
ncbi:MAG: hypothetical protein ABSA30_00960 [Candidatus Aminicenantales bacterium]|jgi:hypothetical protein